MNYLLQNEILNNCTLDIYHLLHWSVMRKVKNWRLKYKIPSECRTLVKIVR